MRIGKSQSVPPITPVVRVDNDRRQQSPRRPLAFAGKPTTQAGGAATRDELTFGGPAKQQLGAGLYGRDGRLI